MQRLLIAGCLLAGVALSACGFTLRGAALLPESMARVHLVADDMNSLLVLKLEQALRQAGAEVAPSPAAATATLRILDDIADERVLSVSARGQPQEYELFHTVRFALTSDDGTLVEPVTLTLTRDYFFDEQDILGKREDAEFLQDALAEDVARTIVRRAALATRSQGN